jgi:hypothetical protein
VMKRGKLKNPPLYRLHSSHELCDKGDRMANSTSDGECGSGQKMIFHFLEPNSTE